MGQSLGILPFVRSRKPNASFLPKHAQDRHTLGDPEGCGTRQSFRRKVQALGWRTRHYTQHRNCLKWGDRNSPPVALFVDYCPIYLGCGASIAAHLIHVVVRVFSIQIAPWPESQSALDASIGEAIKLERTHWPFIDGEFRFRSEALGIVADEHLRCAAAREFVGLPDF